MFGPREVFPTLRSNLIFLAIQILFSDPNLEPSILTSLPRSSWTHGFNVRRHPIINSVHLMEARQEATLRRASNVNTMAPTEHHPRVTVDTSHACIIHDTQNTDSQTQEDVPSHVAAQNPTTTGGASTL